LALGNVLAAGSESRALLASYLPARRHDIPERIKAFPGRLDRSHSGGRHVHRRFGERHRGNVTRTIRKDHVDFDADDQLRADSFRKQGIVTVNPSATIDPQSLRIAM